MGSNQIGQYHEINELIEEMLTGLQFGYVTITVQDGNVIQIEKNEKHRLK
ncbi:YezD family protein [Geomicrobium sp. JCM 19039]|nr:YezD family protein [Geomicrobium sp. JCM 19039]